jgi:DNA-binding NtrC family response regulator
MSAEPNNARILLIRAWTEPFAPFRAALRAAGLHTRIARVDIEPALNAALGRSSYDVIVLDPTTPGITREIVEARMREHGRFIPIVVLASGPLEAVADAIKHALDAKLN